MDKVEKPKILGIYGNKVYYGHERSNIQVFNVLNEEGFELLILTNKEGIAAEAKALMDFKKIPYKGITFPIWDDMRKPFTFVKVIRYLSKVIGHNIDFIKEHNRSRPDYIYIANDFMYISLLPSFLWISTPIVYRLGDEPVTAWKPFRFFWKHVIVKRTTRFVCISNYIRDRLIAAGRDPLAPDSVIYNFPPERILTSPTTINYSKKGLTFSYLGQIIGIKGLAEFIDAAITTCNKTSDVYFTLAGSLTYDSVFVKTQVDKVVASGFEKRIIFLGAVENIQDFFNKTDVLVTPSIKQEPLGNVLVEAKANSTPSIIFKSGGMPELIKSGIDGYVCQEPTADELVKAFKYYLNNTECVVVQSKRAFKSILDLGIDYESYVKNWNNVFNN
jgi:glycosyltransferase involved in cell wall biosynthesis